MSGGASGAPAADVRITACGLLNKAAADGVSMRLDGNEQAGISAEEKDNEAELSPASGAAGHVSGAGAFTVPA